MNKINEGDFYYGTEIEYDVVQRIYRIHIQNVDGDKVQYSKVELGFWDCTGIFNDSHCCLMIYKDEGFTPIYPETETTLTQMQTGKFDNIRLFEEKGVFLVIN